ncbi:MAG: alpha/beta hydrolase [Cellvibrionaceae bacterium]
MKSSSRFFPARLMSAEVYGGLAEDVYLVKPNNSPDKSVELAVTHVTSIDGRVSAEATPLVLVHGLYQNKRMWCSDSATLAESLVAVGFDVWMLEFRGHGHSPINQLYSRNTMADYARYDLPAVNMFIEEQTGKPVNWLGCGAGGGALLMALALRSFDEQSLGQVLGMGVPFYAANWSRVPGISSLLMARRLQAQEASGPEPEPMSLLANLVKENHWFATRGAYAGVDLWRELDGLRESWCWLFSDESPRSMDSSFGADSSQGLADNFHCKAFSELEFVGEGLYSWLAKRPSTLLFAKEVGRLLSLKEKLSDVPSAGKAPSVA